MVESYYDGKDVAARVPFLFSISSRGFAKSWLWRLNDHILRAVTLNDASWTAVWSMSWKLARPSPGTLGTWWRISNKKKVKKIFPRPHWLAGAEAQACNLLFHLIRCQVRDPFASRDDGEMLWDSFLQDDLSDQADPSPSRPCFWAIWRQFWKTVQHLEWLFADTLWPWFWRDRSSLDWKSISRLCWHPSFGALRLSRFCAVIWTTKEWLEASPIYLRRLQKIEALLGG